MSDRPASTPSRRSWWRKAGGPGTRAARSQAVALERELNQIPGVVTVGLFAVRPADVLLIGTDYGHSDVSSEVDALRLFRKLDTIPESAKDKVLSINPARLYGISHEQ